MCSCIERGSGLVGRCRWVARHVGAGRSVPVLSNPTWLTPRDASSSECTALARPRGCCRAGRCRRASRGAAGAAACAGLARALQRAASSKVQGASTKLSSSSVQLQRPAPGRSTQVIEVDVVEPQEPEQDVREGIVDDVGQLHWGLGSGPAVRLVEGRPVAAARAGGGGRRTRSLSSSQRTNGSWL